MSGAPPLRVAQVEYTDIMALPGPPPAGRGFFAHAVIPGRAKREPGIHRAAETVDEWIPGSRFTRLE
jgi:hypothetical protein